MEDEMRRVGRFDENEYQDEDDEDEDEDEDRSQDLTWQRLVWAGGLEVCWSRGWYCLVAF